MARIDLRGRKFGRLLVLDFAFDEERKRNFWACRCDCGNLYKINFSHILLSGHTRSCGCIKSEGLRATHGKSRSAEHYAWLGMKRRCRNPNDAAYMNYGGRGITVCDRWVNSFENFLADMGQKPPGTSIDRINNDAGYSKDNCRWANRTEQNRNRRNNRYLTAFGKTLLITDWSRETGIDKTTITTRIQELRWSVDDAVSIPVGVKPRSIKRHRLTVTP